MEKPPYSRALSHIIQFGGIIVAMVGIAVGCETIYSSFSESIQEQVRIYVQLGGAAQIIAGIFAGLFVYLVGGIGLAVLDIWENQDIELEEGDLVTPAN